MDSRLWLKMRIILEWGQGEKVKLTELLDPAISFRRTLNHGLLSVDRENTTSIEELFNQAERT